MTAKSLSLAALLLAASASTAIAQEETPIPPVEDLEIYEFEFNIIDDILNQPVYAPFRQESTVKESSRPAYVINREQIEAQGYRTVNEALQYFPGIFTDGTAGTQLGAQSGQFIRGGRSTQSLILLDGRPINELGSFGSFDLSRISIGSLERIELIPGGGSTLFGSSAIAGVINIVTRQPELGQPASVNAGAELGSFGYNRQSISVSNGSENVAVRLGYERTAAKNDFGYDLENIGVSGTRDNADATLQNLDLQVLGMAGDRHEVSFKGLYLSKDLGVPGGIPTGSGVGAFNSLSPNANQYTNDVLLSLGVKSRLGNGDNSELNTKIFADFNNYYYKDPDGFFPADDEVKSRSLGTQIQHNWQFTPNQNIAYGFDYRHIQTSNESSGFENYDEEINQGAIFARYALDVTPKLQANLGIRQDFNSLANGSFTSPSAGVRWQATENTSLRANYARNFRVPSGGDLFYAPFNNPNLKPEVGNSFDIGVDQKIGDRALFRLTYFNNVVDDAINFDLNTFTPQNVGKVRFQGLEAALNVQIAKSFYGFVNYTLNDSKILKDSDPTVEGNELSFSGADALNIGVAYENPQGVYVGLFVRNLGDRLVNNSNTQSLSSYTNVDIRARYPINENVALIASWENIFDENFEVFPGFPGEGSRFQIGVNAKLR